MKQTFGAIGLTSVLALCGIISNTMAVETSADESTLTTEYQIRNLRSCYKVSTHNNHSLELKEVSQDGTVTTITTGKVGSKLIKQRTAPGPLLTDEGNNEIITITETTKGSPELEQWKTLDGQTLESESIIGPNPIPLNYNRGNFKRLKKALTRRSLRMITLHIGGTERNLLVLQKMKDLIKSKVQIAGSYEVTENDEAGHPTQKVKYELADSTADVTLVDPGKLLTMTASGQTRTLCMDKPDMNIVIHQRLQKK